MTIKDLLAMDEARRWEEMRQLAKDVNAPDALAVYREWTRNTNVSSWRAIAITTIYGAKHPEHCARQGCRAVDGGGTAIICASCALRLRERAREATPLALAA